MNPRFIHLRLHSEFSLVDGLVRIKPLMESLRNKQMPAVALTDQSNLFALVKFQKAAFAAGIKPIFGADLRVWNEQTENSYDVCLLVQNKKGYQNLTELISKSYLTGQKQGLAYIDSAWLQVHHEGLICLSAGRQGELGKILINDGEEAAQHCARKWLNLFADRFYIEVQRTGRNGEDVYNQKVVKLASELSIPLVATNDVRFISSDEFEAHETRVCVNDGRTLDDPRREKRYSEQQYLRSPEEMQELFSDLPEALENSVEIAKRCNFYATLGKSFLPNYPIPDGQTLEEFFKNASVKGLNKRLGKKLDKNQSIDHQSTYQMEQRQMYLSRLQFELDIINQMGFAGYFLIVMDFILWAKNHDVPVGPGRGSGAGSLVAYALEITDLDPLAYDLLFERFLNPERVSMPDFDIDFCMDGRDRVIDYVADRYGRDAVSQIITYGTMAAKAVVRDVARVQGKSYGLADKLSKMIPFEVGITLKKAMESEEALRNFVEQDEQANEIMEMAYKLEGLTRNVGKHAGGVVISPTKLTDFSPLYCDETGANLVTQFDKDDVESVGLVKFDFLGLRTLTIIDWTVKSINRERALKCEPVLEIENIPLNDADCFEYLRSAQTTAIFQLESRGMKDLITRLQPSTFEDIIALVALFRPGPLQSGMVDDFINRKHGRAKVEYPHPDLEGVLKNTYGVIVYQEQVMQIAQILANYTLGEADMLRRAMGKKKPEEMSKQRSLFNQGAAAKGVDEKTATSIFDLMEKFAEYGFNKSHSAAYALVSYQTLWLKTHYPSHLMASVLSADMDNTDKIVTLIDECRVMKLPLVVPSVNSSEYRFVSNDKGEIVYGLGAIKGVGEGPIESIISARKQEGRYKDLFEFCRRTSGNKVNRKVLEALIRSGAMDEFSQERSVLMASLDSALQAAEQNMQNLSSGIEDMFGLAETESPATHYAKAKPWNENERLQGEKETLGLYLTGHPFDQFEKEVAAFITKKISQLKNRAKSETICGIVEATRVMPGKRGKIAFVSLNDRSGTIELTIYSEILEQHEAELKKDAIFVVSGEISEDTYSGGLKMLVSSLMSLQQAREHYLNDIRIQIKQDNLSGNFGLELKKILMNHGAKGQGFIAESGCPIVVELRNSEASALFRLGAGWRVAPEEALLDSLKSCFGAHAVFLNYSRD